jgi:hypothetical protein
VTAYRRPREKAPLRARAGLRELFEAAERAPEPDDDDADLIDW